MTTIDKLKKHEQSYAFNPMIGNFVSWIIGVAIMAFYVNGYTKENWPMLFGVFIACIWCIRLHAYREAYRIEIYKIRINHKERLIVRSVVILFIGQLISTLSSGVGQPSLIIGKESLIQGLCCSFYIGTIFWLLFDFILNLDRGKALFYVSSAYNAAWFDRLFSKINPAERSIIWLASKVIAFTIGLALYNWAMNR